MKTITWKTIALSVILTIIMVFSMMPLSVFATTGAADVAEVTVGGTTTKYATLTEAIEAAQGADITLLPSQFGENVVVEDGTTASIILGGLINENLWSYRWTGLSSGIPLTVKGGDVTLKGGVLAQGSAGPDAKNAISLEGGTLTIEGDATKIIGALGVSQKPAIDATGGTLVLNGNAILDGGLEMNGTATAGNGLKCGIFTNSTDAARISVEDSEEYTFVFDLLAPGYVFAKYENGKAGAVIDWSETASLSEDVIVIACTHKDSNGKSLFRYGSCTVCDFTCTQHTLDDNGTCETCGEKFAAKDDKGNYYGLLETALWEVAPGGTVTVLADLSENVGFNVKDKKVTLNLDGHSLTSSEFDVTLTVNDGLLTVINGVAGSATADEPIRISHAKSNGTAISVSDGELILGSKLEANAEVYVNGGKITFEKAATFNAGLSFRSKCNGITLPVGSIVKNSGDDDRIHVYDGAVFDLLPENCVFAEYKSDGSTGNIIKKDTTTNDLHVDVIVVAHLTHTFDADGKCACGYECAHESNSREASYFQKAICANCGEEYGDMLKDETAPTGKIAINGSYPSEKLFLTEDVTVTIEAEDDSYSHAGYDETKHAVKIEYLISTWTLPADQLPNQTFAPYSDPIKLSDEKDYVVYVRLTDHAGNVVYINSEVTINAAPEIIGAENNGVYYVTRRVTIVDRHLQSVTLNGEPVDMDTPFDLIGDMDATYTIVAIDQMGNRAEFTITMKPISAITDTIKDFTTENVKSDNAKIIETIAKQIRDIAAASDKEVIGEEQWNKLQEASENCDELVARIAEAKAKAESDEILAVEEIAKDNVTLDNKDALEKAETALEDAQKDFGDNYTEEELESLKAKLDTVKAALGAIGNAEQAAMEIEKLPSADEVELADKDEVERVKELVDALTENEKAMLGKEAVDKVAALNEKVAELAAAASRRTALLTGLRWIALLLICGGAITGVVLVYKKKRRQDR